MSAEGGTRAIIAALGANLGIAVAKFVGFLLTGSSSMLAESAHSVADSGNQGLLLIGGKRARRQATENHPFGFGRDRYFYAFVVALVLFTLGSLFSLYEGYHKLRDHGAELDRPLIAVIILLVAIGLEGFSLRTAVHESNEIRDTSSWFQFIRRAKAPELPVVLLEDTAALLGLVFALAGVGLSWATGDVVWDAWGTIMIGLLLGVIAIILIIETKSLLIGEGASPQTLDAIVAALVGPGVDRVIHLRTQYLGPDELLVAAKIAVPRTTVIERVATAIDDAERRVRQAVPEARLIYLEPDLERPAGRRAVGADPDTPEFEHSP
ncbi:MAG TPA: cation diffusion facilitator family transporter [Mycobacteriales bacterium]|nr:cation diffusion facilitator family transporter [Mycobacteriales bacterium]